MSAPDSTMTTAEGLLTDPPKLHVWGGEPRIGGLNQAIGHRLITEIQARETPPRIIETGAGLSTLLFLCFELKGLTSIAPDDELRGRIEGEAQRRGIAVDALRYISERSEIALPPLAAAGEEFDVALIDGNHGWPSAFVDFCYVNQMLGKGSILFVDDVQLYSVAQLFHLLRQEKDFELVSVDNKLATFRKTSDRPFLPDWRAEPFIFMNTVAL